MFRTSFWALAVALGAVGCGSSNSDVGFGSGGQGGSGAAGTGGSHAGGGGTGGSVGGAPSGGGAAGVGGVPSGGGAAGAGGAPSGGGTGGTAGPIVDLRADVNRDGTVDTTGTSDDVAEETWDATHGAIFLANIDDDELKCPKGSTVTDAELAACFDGANTTVDGADDLTDLARIKTVPWPGAPAGASATLSWAPAGAKVRVFQNSGGTFNAIANGATLGQSGLQSGVEFAIEGTDILRDTTWDGYVTLTLTLTAGGTGSDTLRMRLSPVMLFHHAEDALKTYVTPFSSTASQAFRTDMQAACAAGGSAYTELPAGIGDQWTQDYFEPGYESMPAPGGQQKIIRVYFRSANYTTSGGLRKGGRVVYEYFRGKDAGGITQYDPNHPDNANTLNSFGNTETVPPYSYNGKSFPLGRIVRGSTSSFYPDQSFEALLTAQAVQPQIFLDTSWLLVGHVDETISYLKVNSPRGWIVLANDAALAKQMLQTAQSQGYGSTPMFVGKTWSGGISAQTTINEVLNDTNVMSSSALAVTNVNNQLATLKAETGITDAEIVNIPFLFWTGNTDLVAFQPGTVNLSYVGPTVVAAPNPWGPVINGVDIFEDQMEKALAPYGINVKWVEDWDLYHRLDGEVHCGANTDRAVTLKWWETGK